MMEEPERTLFDLLVLKTLEAGGSIGFSRNGIRWKRTDTAYVRQQERAGERSWPLDDAAVLLDIHQAAYKWFDEVAFYMGDSPDGVTWRMMKLDMSFLRIVLSGNKDVTKMVLGEIIRRLVAIMNEAIEGGKGEKYDGRN